MLPLQVRQYHSQDAGKWNPGWAEHLWAGVARPREEWSVIEGAHEAVVIPEDFAAVQKVLALDTRTSPGSSAVELFSGMAACGECGAAMVRKTVPAGGKKYVYYVCAAHKNDKTCYTHSIRDRLRKSRRTAIRAICPAVFLCEEKAKGGIDQFVW